MIPITTAQEFYSAMSARYRESTGFSPEDASDIGIRLRVLAEELEHLGKELGAIRSDAFPQTACGEALDLHAQCGGIFRIPAQCAVGTLRFSRSLAGPEVRIPAGTVCLNVEGTLRFQTAGDTVIPEGMTEAEALATALIAGEQGNAAQDTVRVLLSVLPGVSAVRNPAPFSGGMSAETDEQLRSRLMLELGSPADSANRAYYLRIAHEHPGVRSVELLPRLRGGGTLDVVVACRDGFLGQAVTAELTESYQRSREIGTDLLVRAVTPHPADVSALIVIAPGQDEQEISARCISAVEDHINNLPIGKPLFIARITECLIGVGGIVNVRVVTPKQDIAPASDEIITVGELAVGRVDSL